MSEELWNYAVYHAQTAADLSEKIRADIQLTREDARTLEQGLLAAVAFPESKADESKDALRRRVENDEMEVEVEGVRMAGPAEVDLTTQLQWMFPGQGAQRVGLLQSLYRRSSFFKAHLELLLEAASTETGLPLLDALYPEDGATPDNEARLTTTSYCQPVMVGVSLALAAWFREAGLRVDGAMGHSLGEFAASACLGGLTQIEVMAFVAARGQLMVNSLEGQDAGAMAAIMAPATAVAEALEEFPDVIVANINQPKQTVISGPTASVELAVKALRKLRLPGKKLSVSHAFHSPLMRHAATALRPKIDLIELKSLSAPLHSAILDTSISRGDTLREMFERHAESPVNYIRALHHAAASGDAQIFVEMGAGKTLTSFCRYTLGDEATVIQTASTSEDGDAQIVQAIVQLVSQGIPLGCGMLSI